MNTHGLSATASQDLTSYNSFIKTQEPALWSPVGWSEGVDGFLQRLYVGEPSPHHGYAHVLDLVDSQMYQKSRRWLDKLPDWKHPVDNCLPVCALDAADVYHSCSSLSLFSKTQYFSNTQYWEYKIRAIWIPKTVK